MKVYVVHIEWYDGSQIISSGPEAAFFHEDDAYSYGNQYCLENVGCKYFVQELEVQ